MGVRQNVKDCLQGMEALSRRVDEIADALQTLTETLAEVKRDVAAQSGTAAENFAAAEKETRARFDELSGGIQELEDRVEALDKASSDGFKGCRRLIKSGETVRTDLLRMEEQIDKGFKAQNKTFRRYYDDYFAYGKTTDADRAYRGGEALHLLLELGDFHTVLDIGSGEGIHSRLFAEAGKEVTAIDYGKSPLFRENASVRQIIADFNTYDFGCQFDCVWASHVLEHQLNPNLFLKRIHSLTKEGGYVAITVPPLKQMIVGGHVTLWNAGLLLYHLVLAGFDCSDAHVKSYGYNVSVIVKKRTVDVMPLLCYDRGDLRAIRQYLPEGLDFHVNEVDDPFTGGIRKLNWDAGESAKSDETPAADEPPADERGS